jgi:hypothetical protein
VAKDDNADMEALHAIARRATKDAGLRAYWIGCSCMPDEHEMEKDVYRINDVVRGARAVVIAIGYNNSGGPSDDAELLREWGSRMWTYPEVLLSPNDDIKVFFRIGKRVRTIAKKHFAGEVWTDASTSRQLLGACPEHNPYLRQHDVILLTYNRPLCPFLNPESTGACHYCTIVSIQPQDNRVSTWRPFLCANGSPTGTSTGRAVRHCIPGVCPPQLGK